MALFFAVVVIVMFVAAIVMANRTLPETPRTRLLRSLATRVGGTVENETLQFTIGGRKARIVGTAGGGRGGPVTSIVVDVWGGSPGSLHILPAGLGQSFLTFLGARNLGSGDADFDQRFVVRATPESLASTLFSPERRRQLIDSVNGLRGFTDSTFDLDLYVLTIRVFDYLDNEADLMRLVEAAKDFCRYLVTPGASAAVQIVDVRVSMEGACPVCATAGGERFVRCERCQTPHHEECWTYMGRCSVYACTGTRYTAGPVSGHDRGAAAS